MAGVLHGLRRAVLRDGARGAEENALLAVASKLVSVVGLFSVSFRTAWQPLAMSYIGDERGEQFYVQSLRVFTAGAMLSAFAMTVLTGPALADPAPGILRNRGGVCSAAVVASILGELEVNLQLGNQIAKKTYWMSVGAALAFVTNIGVLWVFTAAIGIYAVGLGLLCSFVVRTVVTYVSAQRSWRINYDARSLWLFVAGCVLLVGLSLVPPGGVAVRATTLCVACVAGSVLPWMTLSARERAIIRDVLSRALGRLSGQARAQVP